MSLVIRLRGLPAVADSFDVRQFFCGLNIPRGGVYITGGKFGEAYIVFATYEDSRCALSLSGHLLKDSIIHLAYSNEEEMRHALEVYQIGLRPTTSSAYGAPLSSRGSYSFSYLYLHGMPPKVTKVEIREFFKGLLVEDVLFLKSISGIRNGNAIVKFGRSTDASEGLKLNNRLIYGAPLIIKLSNEVEWMKNDGERVPRRRRSPIRVVRRRSRSRSPIRRRSRRGSPYVREYFVHLINLSHRAEKKDIKKFFFDLEMKDSQITFLVDKEGKRTREGFAMFTTEKDYKRALGLNNENFKGHTVTILPIPKKAMTELIDRMKVRVCKDTPSKKKSPSRSSKERRYLYLRNFAFDITKSDVQKFFTEVLPSVKEDDVVLLQDSKGVGLGEALVKFADEKLATKAETENKQTYLGLKILLSRITGDQMRALKEANQANEMIVTESDEMPDFTSDAIPDIIASSTAPPEQTNGDTKAPDSKEAAKSSEVKSSEAESVPPADKEPEKDTSEIAQAVTLTEENPTEENATEENPMEENLEYALGGDEELAEEAKNNTVTLLFIRNLPASVTVAEILDLFHDYKVSSVNLKNIEKGVATVRMQNYAEAESAIATLNKKEVGLKQVFLSLF